MQIIELTTTNRYCLPEDDFLGYEGENNANKLIFKFTDGFIDGLAELILIRDNEKGVIELKKVGDTYEFPVKSSVLTKEGILKFQLVITNSDGDCIKYNPFTMKVRDALDSDIPMPEEYPSWIELANSKLAELEEAIINSETVINQLLEDKENGVFNGKDGEDGFSPSAKVVQTDTGAVITIEDKDGITSATIKHGQGGGEGGGTGADGFSPIANVTQTSNGAKITITDKSGTTTAEVLNGKDGKDGEKGEQGEKGETGATGKDGVDGKNGEDGITPHIGDNGNWWIGDTDTGVPAIGSGTGGTGTPSVIKEIFSGNAKVVNTNYNLSESIENFDLLVVMGGHDGGFDIQTLTIPVSNIISNYGRTYSLDCIAPSSSELKLTAITKTRFKFVDNSTFTPTLALKHGWEVDGITSIYGIKLGGGKDGEDYVLTEADKREIANITLSMIQDSEEVSY